MSCTETVRTIAQYVSDYFGGGIYAGNEVEDYAYRTLGLSSAEEIGELLSEGDSYAMGLTDLVFYPAEDLQLRIESVLADGGISADEENDLINRLCTSIKSVSLFIGSGVKPFKIDVGMDMLKGFIRRLGLRLPLDADIYAALSLRGDDDTPLRARLKIRKGRFHRTRARLHFISRMCLNLLPGNHRPYPGCVFLQCIDFIISLFGEVAEERDIFFMLAEKRKGCVDILRKARDYDELLVKYSMDYLMSQKIYPPPVNREETEQMIKIADIISRAMFGKTAEMPGTRHTLNIDAGSHDRESIEDIIRLLS